MLTSRPSPASYWPATQAGANVEKVLASLRTELVKLSSAHPELANAKDIEIHKGPDDTVHQLKYSHNCKYWGKRGYEDTGPNALAITFRIMAVHQFKEDVGKKEMQGPSHRWLNLGMVGWIAGHIGENPSPGLADKLDGLLKKHREMIDELDRQAGQPPTQAEILSEEAKEFERLKKIIFSKGFPDAREAALVMGKLKSPKAVEVLIEALQDCDAQTAMGIGNALGKIRDRKAIPALMSLFDRQDALDTLASNPRNANLATVAHYALRRITKERLSDADFGMGMISDEEQLIAARDAWRGKLGLVTDVAKPTTQPGEAVDELLSFNKWKLVKSNCGAKYERFGYIWSAGSTKINLSPLWVTPNKDRKLHIYTSPLFNSAIETSEALDGFILRAYRLSMKKRQNTKKINFSSAKLILAESNSELDVITQQMVLRFLDCLNMLIDSSNLQNCIQ